MADTRPWLKLWKSAYSDQGLTHLSLHDQGCWLRLLLYVSLHGEHGVLVLKRGISELCDLFTDWVTTDETGPEQAQPEPSPHPARTRPEPGPNPGQTRVRPRPLGVRRLLKRLPGVRFQEAVLPDSPMTVSFTKWSKYQVDSSAERMRSLRQRQHGRDDTSPSRRDDVSPSQVEGCDGARSRSRRESPHSPPVTPSTTTHAPPPENPRDAFGAFPPACFRTDCPDPDWRGRCVDQAYADAHPGRYPVQFSTGQPVQCPLHRPLPQTGPSLP